ncbi:MAG: potassium transporter [Xanthomonadales bacterium]|nr:potassium transporter [Xanthomonadales bacterium]
MFSGFFAQAFIYLLAAVIAVPLAKRLGLGSALGYILAGVVIGPYVLGFIGEEGTDVMHFAEFGVVLMLFLVGLELEPAVLWRMRVPILGMGGMQVGATALIIGGVAMWFGLEWQTALTAGLVLALSSTAIVLQTLNEKGWMTTPAGKRSFSVLLFQDIAVIPILAAIPFLAVSGLSGVAGDGHGAGMHLDLPGWLQALVVVGAVVGIVVAGRFLARPVFHYIAQTGSREVFIAAALLLVVGITLAMNAVGLSPALGTFLAGVVLAESEYRHELESNIEPFKGLLLGLFFITVGASLDHTLVLAQPWLIAGLVGMLIVIKFLVLLGIGRFFNMAPADNLMFAATLAQGGEFAFLLVSFAVQNGALGVELANLLIVVVVLSMVATPLVIIAYERWVRPRFADCGGAREDDEIDAPHNQVIIAGYGRFGQIVSRLLKASGFETTLLDHDAGQIELVGRFGNKVFYGDASRAELLEAAGARDARVLVIAIDDRVKAVRMVETARLHFPKLKILARAYDRRHAYELMRAGAECITRETFNSALSMGEDALSLLGISPARAERMARMFEEHDTAGMKKLYEVWGDDQAYGLRVRQNLADLEKVLRDDSGLDDDSDLGEEAGRPVPE